MAAIVAADIVFRYSVLTGSAGNTVANAVPNNSLGKYMSTSPWPGPGALNDLFDDISGAENSAGMTDYRCFFVYNSNAANALQNAVVYQTAEVAGGASISLAVDTTGVVPIGQAGAQALIATNETTGPQTGLSYVTTAISVATGLALGTIGIGQCRAVWVKRTITSTSAVSGDGVTINVAGDTGSL